MKYSFILYSLINIQFLHIKSNPKSKFIDILALTSILLNM
jgi:hypothetical protein